MYIATFINVRFLKFELEISVWQTIKYLSAYVIPAFASIALLQLGQNYLDYSESFFIVFIEIVAFVAVYLFVNFKVRNKGLFYSLALINKKYDQRY
jgi:general stress protein CsbA